MDFWIDIENAAGAKQGDGPITTALSWESTRRLDRAGTFKFTVPLGERNIALIDNKRIARCWGVVDGVVTEIGAGIIDLEQSKVTAANLGFMEVSGPDLLQELAYRSVHGLAIYEEEIQTPLVKFYNAGVYVDLTNATDGNAGTFDTAEIAATDSFLYIGAPNTFNYVSFNLGPQFNTTTTTINYGFSDDEGGWEEPIVTDATISGGNPLGQDGTVTFIRPSNWVLRTIDGDELYWIRLDPEDALTKVDFREITVTSRKATQDDLTDILAFAPSGWTYDVSYYDSTTGGTFQLFAGETVLAALIKTAEKTGEHFRLGVGRTVQWLRTDQVDCGITAIDAEGVDPIALESNANVCLVRDPSKSVDTAPLITRIYPYGAGNGDARVTIEESDLTVPAGYTKALDVTAGAWYIKQDAAETAYGRIEAVKDFPEIKPSDETGVNDLAASNELFTAALTHLRQHSEPYESYTFGVLKVDGVLLPGDTIHVDYRRVADNRTLMAIDADVTMLETVTRIDQNSLRTIALQVATVDRWPEDDYSLLAKQLDGALSYKAHAQPILTRQVR